MATSVHQRLLAELLATSPAMWEAA